MNVSPRSISAHCIAVLLAAAPAFAQLDFGDAPDSYGTLLASGGARHTINLSIRLGPQIDAEADGAPGPLALGDDATGFNDEDGVTVTNLPTKGAIPWQTGAWTQVQVDVRLTGAVTSAMLDGWVDFNHDGVFSAGERVFTNKVVRNGVQSLGIFTPAGVTPGVSYARFRLSSAGVSSPTGPAADGEVEDYRIVFVAPSPATTVLAHTSRGQVWVTWDFDVNAPAQAYEIYKSATPVANVAQA